MFCVKCGAENDERAKFCKNCGAELKDYQAKTELRKTGNIQKKKTKKIWVIIGIVFLIAAICIAVFVGLKMKKEKKIQQDKKKYEQLMSKADKYLEELDYDNAEEFYLNAIKIDPKQEKPYLKLADLYVVQEKYDEAVEVLNKAEKNVDESSNVEQVTKDKSDSKKSEIAKKKEEISGAASYNWIMDPTLELDDVYYLPEDEKTYAENDTQRQDFSAYVVMKKGDAYGLMKDDGTVVADLDYKEIYKFNDLWIMNRKVPKYVAEYQQEWSQYAFDEGKNEIVPIELGGAFLTGGIYYYNNGLKNSNQYSSAYEILSESPYVFSIPEYAIPVKKAFDEYDERKRSYWESGLSEKYAIYHQDELKTDFIYEECGSDMAGLLAVKKDGKWGYVDEDGNVVIPIEYDASWNGYTIYDYSLNERVKKEYCYAAAEGYVPLVKNGVWEMRNTQNELVILPGVFEQILPIHNGRCWVKKNGKWGIIQMSDSTEEDATSEKKTEEKGNVVTGKDVSYVGMQAIASSTLASSDGYDYGLENLGDQDAGTCWSEGVEGDGIGEFIYCFESYKVSAAGIAILPGLNTSEELFKANNCPTEISVTLDDTKKYVFDLSGYVPDFTDPMSGMLYCEFSQAESFRKAIVQITKVREGTKYQDTCISEMYIYQ